MKTYALTIVLVCFLCTTSYAQNETLTPDAAELFKLAYTKLNTSEKNTIANLSGFTLNKDDKRMYRATYTEEANMPFNVRVYILDLTNDGIEEIGIVYSPKSGLGKTGIASMLFVKDTNGQYTLNIDTPGEFYFMNLTDLAFPDVLIKNTTIGLPTYRWNGSQYYKHKFISSGTLKRFVITTMQQASNRYTTKALRE